MRRIVLCLVATLGLVAASGGSAAKRPPLVQRELAQLVAAGVPGVLLYVRDSKGSLHFKAGSETLQPRRPIRIDDRFRVGSVTKTFVATVVLQLEAEGALSLDDPVIRWLPGLVPQGDQITIRMLLGHTSGLFDYVDDPAVLQPYLDGDLGHVWSPLDLVAIATAHPPTSAPGAQWNYSNTGYIVLGLIVEKATGDTIGHQIEQRIVAPLGLAHTTFETEPDLAGRHADGYARIGDTLVDVTRLSPTVAWSAGAIASTVDDLARFEQALLGGRLLAPPQLAEMKTTVPIGGGAAYGLGLLSLRTPCGVYWGHDGDFPGYLTEMLERADGRRQIVVSVTTDTLSPRAQTLLGAMLARALCGKVR